MSITRTLPAQDVRPGDIIRYPFGIHRTPGIVTVHDTHAYDSGILSIRYRFTSNPRGVDWHGLITPDKDITLLSRGVARIDATPRTLLPGD